MLHIFKLKLRYQLFLKLVVSNIILALPPEVSGKKGAIRPQVVGGVEAEPNEFPFLAEIRLYNRHHCGGAFVTPEYIVTAAHCMDRLASDFIVYGGEHRLSETDGTEQKRDGVETIVHEDYTGENGGFINDIALLKVNRPFELNEYVKLSVLPEGASFEPTPSATVMGWGHTYEGGGSPNVLNKVEVPHVEYDKCKELYKDDGEIKDTQLCYGYDQGGKDACQGDSGGPLVCGEDHVLCGIVSVGVGCARKGKPGIYTEVAKYADWINKNVKKSSE